MAFPIYRDVINGIIIISNLSEILIDKLSVGLIEAQMVPESDEMAENVHSHLSEISLDNLKTILDLIYRLYFVKEVSNVSVPKFVDDIIDGIIESNYDELKSDSIDLVLLKNKFLKILDIDNLKKILKATRLQYDDERIYCESKIISDIRPVFDDDPTLKPSVAVSIHTLKIIYHIRRELKEFHVVLNSNELESLKNVIDRACKKAQTIREMMKDARLSDLGG